MEGVRGASYCLRVHRATAGWLQRRDIVGGQCKGYRFKSRGEVVAYTQHDRGPDRESESCTNPKIGLIRVFSEYERLHHTRQSRPVVPTH